MPHEPVTHNEQQLFSEAIDAKIKALEREDKRQNERLKVLEEIIPKLNEISLQIKDLYGEIKNIVKEMQHNHERMNEHSKEINSLKNRDGEKWREFTGYIGAAIVGAIISHFFQLIAR